MLIHFFLENICNDLAQFSRSFLVNLTTLGNCVEIWIFDRDTLYCSSGSVFPHEKGMRLIHSGEPNLAFCSSFLITNSDVDNPRRIICSLSVKSFNFIIPLLSRNHSILNYIPILAKLQRSNKKYKFTYCYRNLLLISHSHLLSPPRLLTDSPHHLYHMLHIANKSFLLFALLRLENVSYSPESHKNEN